MLYFSLQANIIEAGIAQKYGNRDLGGTKQKFLGHALFYHQKTPFYQKGTPILLEGTSMTIFWLRKCRLKIIRLHQEKCHAKI